MVVVPACTSFFFFFFFFFSLCGIDLVVVPTCKRCKRTTGYASREEIQPPVMEERISSVIQVVPDDSKLIEGIGPKIEQLLHAAGFKHFNNWQMQMWIPYES